jgi:phosphoglycolate phosphatase-like HAD superfamily hydrolase
LVTMRKSRQALEEQLKSTGLRHFLDAVLACDHEVGGAGKAEAVRSLFQKSLNSAEALWIGDTEADWQAAKFIQCDVVLISNGLRNEAYLNSLPGAVVKPSIASLKDYVVGRFNVS